MQSLLCSIPGVVVYLNDILITGPSEQEHLDTLEAGLQKLQEAGLKLQKDKCVFWGPLSRIWVTRLNSLDRRT